MVSSHQAPALKVSPQPGARYGTGTGQLQSPPVINIVPSPAFGFPERTGGSQGTETLAELDGERP